MAEEKGKLIPTNSEGNPVEQDEKTKLKSNTKDELIEMINSLETSNKKLKTRNQNLNQNLKDTKDEAEKARLELEQIEEQQEDTHNEAAQMSDTIRIKNRQLQEVGNAYLTLYNSIKGTADQGLKILEYNGILGGSDNE